MRIVILRSKSGPADAPPGPYVAEFDTRYADRVIGNLVNGDDFCGSCGKACVKCRRPYARFLGDRIAAVIDFPARMPFVLEHPARHVPADVPRHDVLVAVCIHEQVLIECVKRCREWGTRGMVAPLEAPHWISGAARAKALRLGEELGVEVAFPKPFCDFRPPAGSVLAEFRETFHIGFPEVKIEVADGVVKAAEVRVSAPCGATYYVAQGLVGRSLDDDLRHDVVARRMHSYPCTSSMEWDNELGDTILHVAGDNHYTLLDQLGGETSREPEMVVSPLGLRLPKPTPVAENVRAVETAKALVLEALEKEPSVSLADLRRRAPSPAALHSALILLGQEGAVRWRGAVVERA